MRYSYSIPLFVAVLVSTASAQFSEGNLAVLRLGDGTASLSSASTSAHIDQFTPAGSYLNTITIPDTGSSALTYSGTAVSEGALTRSTDGRYLTLVGYNTSKGLASVASSSTTTVPRGIATVDFDGHYALEATTTQFTGNNIRSGITDGAHNFWAAGAGGMSSSGIAYLGTASVAASVMNVNARVVNVFNENLYFSTGSGTAGIYGFTGTPTTSSTPTLLFATGTSSSPYDFAISPSGDIAYVADDRASVGIQKWLFDGAAWTLSYTLHTGPSSGGARNLTVDFSGDNPVIYATTTETSANRLVSITDAGSASTATTLATAAPNTVFRGVEFAPVPEPSSLALGGLGVVLCLCSRRRR